MRTLYLCGAGNPEGVRLALGVNRAEKRWDALLLLDDDPSKHGRELLGVPIAGPMSLLEGAPRGETEVVNLVARSTAGRRKVRDKLAAFGHPFASLIDPTVDLEGVTLGEGVTIYRNATASALATIGDHAVVFGGANAGHGSVIGAGAVLAPGAVVNARVLVGEGCYVGSNASVLPDLKIGAWATIGANSAGLSDVPAGATVMGVPAEVVLMAREAAPAEEPLDAPTELAAGRPAGSPEELEAIIREIWCEVLGRADIGLDDKFFDSSGDSLRALLVRDRIQKATRATVSATDLFRFPTVRSLAAHLSGGGKPRGGPMSRGELRRQRMSRA